MIAAIYARKSTGEVGADADAKSVQRQVKDALAFAAARGWVVLPEHIYTADAVVARMPHQARCYEERDASGQPPASAPDPSTCRNQAVGLPEDIRHPAADWRVTRRGGHPCRTSAARRTPWK